MEPGRTDRAVRDIRASVARLWRAWFDADELVQWLPPGGMRGEVLALPRRVAESLGSPATSTGLPGSVTGGTISSGPIDITTLANGAIERAGTSAPAANTAQGTPGREPVRHQVQRGETAFTIARLYNVPAKALADWNGLGPDLAVREGQYLMIPVPGEEALDATGTAALDTTAPGTGSPTPEPPSAKTPLPAEKPLPAGSVAAVTPVSPNLAASQTPASAARFAMPVDGKISRAYEKGKNEGIDVASSAGAPVRAAADGTVAAITQDTSQVQILILKHADGYLTVYANIDGIKVAKGATVKRGQTIATVHAGSPAFVHFEVRKGTDSVDPVSLLQ